MGFNVAHYPDDKERQLSGHDLVIHKNIEYGVDVKTNLYLDKDVCVDAQKIWISGATFWFHLNKNSIDDYIMYKVEDMRHYLQENKVQAFQTRRGPVYWVSREVVNNF